MILQRIRAGHAYWQSEGLGPLLVRSVAGTGAVQLAGMVVGFLVGVQLARGLGVTGYGYYGIAMSVITIATIPGTLGIPKLVTREVAAARARKDVPAMLGILRWADWTCWRISAVIAVAIAIAAAIAWRTNSGVLAAAILLGAPMIALLPLASIRAGGLRGLQHVVIGQLSNNLLRPLAMAILLFVGFSTGLVRGAPAAMALNTFTAVGALALTQFWLSGRLPNGVAERSRERERGWLASSIPMALTDAVQSLQQQLSVLLLGIIAAAANVALLRVSIAAATIIAVPQTVINMVVLPTFSTLHSEGDQARLRKVVTHSARVQFAVVLCLAIPVLLAASPLLELAFGPSYVAAAAPLRILAAGQIINAAAGANGALLNMTGFERRVTRAVSIGLAVNVFLVGLLASSFGSVGAAIALVASQLVWNAILWCDAKHAVGLDTSVMGLRFRTCYGDE